MASRPLNNLQIKFASSCIESPRWLIKKQEQLKRRRWLEVTDRFQINFFVCQLKKVIPWPIPYHQTNYYDIDALANMRKEYLINLQCSSSTTKLSASSTAATMVLSVGMKGLPIRCATVRSRSRTSQSPFH